MFAIGWLELGEAERAQRLLEKCFSNIQGPFQVSLQLSHPHHTNTRLFTESWLPVLTGVEWIIRWLWCSQLSHGYGRIPASCAVWLHWLQVSHKSSHAHTVKTHISLYTTCTQWYKVCHPVFCIEWRRNAWPFPRFFPTTFLSSASVVWIIWAVRWTGCWGKMKSVSYWGNREEEMETLSPVIYRLSWKHQELKSLSYQVTHRARMYDDSSLFQVLRKMFILAINMKVCTLII